MCTLLNVGKKAAFLLNQDIGWIESVSYSGCEAMPRRRDRYVLHGVFSLNRNLETLNAFAKV